MVNGFQDYHLAWLMSHPERSSEWLRSKFREGFEIHHVDCDRSNNAPENLVLIEHEDHMRLHGKSRILSKFISDKRERELKARDARNKQCYEMRRDENMTWAQISAALNAPSPQARALCYAKEHGAPWPLPQNEAMREARRRRKENET